MIDPQTQHVLQDIIGRETRSLLAYIGDAFPWTTAAGEATLAQLRQVVKDEVAAVTALGRYVVRAHVPTPALGAYPSSFTACNFIALDWLLPRLVDAQKKLTAQLEADRSRITHEEARVQVETLLAVKKANLATLEKLATPQAAGT